MADQAPGQIQEVEVAELGGQTADLDSQGREQCASQGRLLVNEQIEGLPPQDLGLDRTERDRCRGPRRSIE